MSEPSDKSGRRSGHSALRVKDGKMETFDPNPQDVDGAAKAWLERIAKLPCIPPSADEAFKAGAAWASKRAAAICKTLALELEGHKYPSREERDIIAIVEAGCRSAFAEAIVAGEVATPSAVRDTVPLAQGAVYTIDGQAYRMCACDPLSPDCPKGRKRTLQTPQYSRCMAPTPDVILAIDGVPSTSVAPTSSERGTYVPWDLETVKQEVKDLFARYGARGEVSPECGEIIDNALDEILTPPPSDWRARAESAENSLAWLRDQLESNEPERVMYFLRTQPHLWRDWPRSAVSANAFINGTMLVSVRRQGSSVGPIIGCTLRTEDGVIVNMQRASEAERG